MMKSFFKILSVALLLCAFVASCSSDSTEPEPAPNPFVPVQGDEIVIPEDTDLSPTISQDGDSKTVRFTAKEPWRAYVADTRAASDWLHVSPTSGEAGEVELTITTERNEAPDDREGYIKIVSGKSHATISVTQKQRDALTVSPSKRTIDARETEFEVEVRANIDFEVEVRADWIEQISTRALTTTVLQFRAKRNIEDQRTATIIIRSGEKSETITIIQEKGNFIVDTERISIDAAAQSVSAKVRANIDFEVESKASWIHYNPTRAMTSYTLGFDIDKNTTGEERIGEITVSSNGKSETITIIQEKGNFIVDTERIRIDAAAQSVSAKVRANIDFEVESKASWIHYNSTRAMTSYTLGFDIDENTTGKERTGEITVSSNGESETITIIQSNEAFDLKFDKTEVSNEGEVITATVNSNMEYAVELPDDIDWLTCVETRAITTKTHNFKIEANLSFKTRSAIIKFVYQSEKGEAVKQVTITQNGSDFGASRTLYELDVNGGQVDVSVQGNTYSSSDIEYYITKGVEWISRIETRAVTAYFTFNIDKNTTGKPREGEIEFTLPDKTNTKVRIVQSATVDFIEIPDPNFKTYMVAKFDKNKDGRISKSEASLITGIYCSNQNIESLEGIEHCPALTDLSCGNNQLTTLDVSNNTALTYLSCGSNNLTTLNVSNNTALTDLSCYNNPLEVLNLGDVNPSRYYYDDDSYYSSYKDYPYFWHGQLGSSTKLKIISSKITKLDVSCNGLQSLDVSECPALTELRCYENPLEVLNLGDVNPSRYYSYSSYKNYPYFWHGQLDSSTKLKIISSKITKLDVSCNGLQSLDVSECPALTELSCGDNPLEVLNLGDVNPSRYYYDSSYKDYPYFYHGQLRSSTKLKIISSKITKLDVSYNRLQSLDVSECPALTELSCYYNNLTTLNVSNNTALTDLSCGNNQLTTLDVSNNTALTKLYCYNNDLTTLNVSNNTALTELSCENNPLEVLNLGDVNPSRYYYSSYLSYKDYPYFYDGRLGSSTKLKIISSKITKLDVSCNGLQSLDVSECPALTELRCYNNPLEVLNLGGVNPSRYYYDDDSYYSSYKDYPYFYDGRLGSSTKLKIISSKITKLDVALNQLQSLDVSECPALTELRCRNNQLTTLDVSNNTALTKLSCYNNPLEVLNLGDVNPSHYDYYSYYSSYADYPYFYDGQLGSSTKLKVISSKITKLDVSCNGLQSLDVSECPALTKLYCYNNDLTTLDVSKTNIGNSQYTYPLDCSPMSTLQTLYLKTGWEISGTNINRSTDYIPEQTKILYKD